MPYVHSTSFEANFHQRILILRLLLHIPDLYFAILVYLSHHLVFCSEYMQKYLLDVDLILNLKVLDEGL